MGVPMRREPETFEQAMATLRADTVDAFTGGITIRAALAEVGTPYDIVEIDLEAGAQFTDEYTRINPCQQVPALELPDGSVLTKNIRILMRLADAHPDVGLAPPCGSVERAQINRWLSFFAMNIYAAEYVRMAPESFTTDPSGAAGIAEAATAFLTCHYGIFESALGAGPYYLGDRFSILDIYVWTIVQWWGDYDGMRHDWPRTLRLVETVMERPKIKPVHDAHFGPGVGGVAVLPARFQPPSTSPPVAATSTHAFCIY